MRGERFRLDVFAAQQTISSLDDLTTFTARWFTSHKIQQPFVIDPAGRFAAEVQADRTLGDRIGVHETPTLFVVGPRGWVDVREISQLYTVIDRAVADAKTTAPTTHAAPARTKAAHK